MLVPIEAISAANAFSEAGANAAHEREEGEKAGDEDGQPSPAPPPGLPRRDPTWTAAFGKPRTPTETGRSLVYKPGGTVVEEFRLTGSQPIKLVLTAEERLARQTMQIGKIVRDAIAANRSLGGKAMKNIEGVFKAIDKDGSGDLDHDEFRVAMDRLGLGLTNDQIVQCIEVLDKDGDGEVSLEEFMALVNKPVRVAVKAISAVNAFVAAGTNAGASEEDADADTVTVGAISGQTYSGSPQAEKAHVSPFLLPVVPHELLDHRPVLFARREGMERGGGVAGGDTKLVLTAEQKLERQTKQIGQVVRNAIKSNRSLGGKSMKSIEGVFKAIDKDGSGDLDHDEFKMAMDRLGLGLSNDQIVQCIEVLDKDGDGEVSLEEFMALINDERGKVRTGETEKEKEEKRKAKEREEKRKADEAAGKGVANRATKLELTKEEKLERQTTQIGKIVREAIRNNRSLGGKAMKNIEGVFKAIDKDGSGDLDHDEFQTAMDRLGLGLSPLQVEQCIEVLDKDGDGEVSLKEFMALVHEPIKKATKVISAANAFAEAGKNAGTANSNRLQAAVAHGSAGWPPPGDNSTHL